MHANGTAQKLLRFHLDESGLFDQCCNRFRSVKPTYRVRKILIGFGIIREQAGHTWHEAKKIDPVQNLKPAARRGVHVDRDKPTRGFDQTKGFGKETRQIGYIAKYEGGHGTVKNAPFERRMQRAALD